mgnify:CR=1 FL=1
MYIFFMSLGCDKNLVDSEEMLGALVSHGFEVTDDESQADVIVVNTCCFIHDAKEESIQAILEMADYKTKGNLKSIDCDRLSCSALQRRDHKRDPGSRCRSRY